VPADLLVGHQLPPLCQRAVRPHVQREIGGIGTGPFPGGGINKKASACGRMLWGCSP
jgi:hypothetical protein